MKKWIILSMLFKKKGDILTYLKDIKKNYKF